MPFRAAIALAALLALSAAANSQHPIGPQCTILAAETNHPDVGLACGAIIDDPNAVAEARVQALLRRGVWHYRARRAVDAERDIDLALTLAPDHPKLLQLRASLHLDDDELDEAGTLASKSAALDPKRASTFEVLASIAWRRGDRRSAIAYFSRVIELAPYNSRARYDRAQLFLQMSRAPDALADTTWLLAQSPGDNDSSATAILLGQPVTLHLAALILHAETLRAMDRFEEAEAQFNAVVTYRRSAVTLTKRSEFLHGLPVGAGMESRLLEAMADAKEAVAIDPRNVRARRQYASTLEYAKRHVEALTEVQRALNLEVQLRGQYSRELPPLFWARARLLRSLGRMDKAVLSANYSLQLAEQVDPHYLQQRVRRLADRGYLQTQGSQDDWAVALTNAVTACMVDETCW